MHAETDSQSQRICEFGPFRVDIGKRRLLREGQPRPLTPKAFEILLFLLQRPGAIITKEELMSAIWPDTIVEENNLTRNISSLRKALGEGPQDHNYIVTVPGRGYSFVANVTEVVSETQEYHSLPAAPESEKSDGAHPNNLSALLTPFVGRRKELDEIKRLLTKSQLRLLTLTGAGGSGKTRLALQVGADLLPEFYHGVFLVELAPIHEPELVASAIAQTLKLKETSNTPLLETLTVHLRSKEMLLLLDNFEQVVAAAPVLTELLSDCDRLKILVTSRAPLHLSCEHEFSVPPLSLPDPARQASLESLIDNEAVTLFTQRAQAVKPNFEITAENGLTVADICIRLDGLPLAIELAAARVKLLPPQAMLARLEHRLQLLVGGPRDLPARQRAMRATIAWSYELLDKDERRLFRRLAVFVGGITLEAAEAVCNSTQEASMGFLETVASLVDKNLLAQKPESQGEPRFLMFETFREFALEQLSICGETTMVRLLHANFFLELAERAEPKLSTAEQGAWLDRLEAEHDNLRAALRWSREEGEIELGSRIAGALGRFWLMRGYYNEGRERLAEFLASGNDSTSAELRTKLLNGAGILAQNQGDYSAARSFFEDTLAIWRELGNKNGVAAALNNLGWVAWRQSDYRAARSLSEEGLALNRELDNKQGIAHSLNNLGFVAHHEGDYESARSFHEESLELRRELGDQRGIAFAQTNLGWAMHKLGFYEQAVALLETARCSFRQLGDKQLLAYSSNILADVLQDQGRKQEAAELLEQSMKTCREIGAKYSLSVGLRLLGKVMQEEGQHERAAALVKESLTNFREIGDRYGAAFALCTLANITHHEGDTQRAMSLLKESLSLRSEIGDKHGIVECLESLANLAISEDYLVRATKLAGAAETLRAGLNICLSSSEQIQIARSKELAASGLDQQTSVSAYETGCEMSIEEAVAFALTDPTSP